MNSLLPDRLGTAWVTGLILLLTGALLLGVFGFPGMSSEHETAEREPFYYHGVIEGPINPVTAGYLDRVIEQAETDRAQGIIIEMDTPGGLMDSMNEMTNRILRADVPVIVWVPRGGDATSAGAFILLSSHVASMASASTIGSATPVQMGGQPPTPDQVEDEEEQETLEQESQDDRMKKVMEWSATKIRRLAAQQDRNQDLAEQFVREGISVGEEEALEEGIIEIRADSVTDLTEQLVDREVELASGESVRFVETSDVRTLGWTWQEDFLKTLTDPQLLMILFSLGFMALIYEITNPGVGIGAVLGGIFLLLGFFGLGMMPINYAGLALIFLGLILMVLDIFVPTFGVLTIGGAISFLLGGVMLFETEAFAVPLGLMIGITAAMVTFVFIMMWLVKRTFVDEVRIGDDYLVGRTGKVKEDLNPEGMVYVWGEYWKAESADGRELRRDTPIRVVEKHERSLTVEEDKPEPDQTTEDS